MDRLYANAVGGGLFFANEFRLNHRKAGGL